MAKTKIELEVSKETHELAVGLAKVVKAVRTATKDGWQLGQDLPAILVSVMSDLVPAVQGVDQIGAEMKEDPAAFGAAILAGIKPAFEKA